MFCVLCGGVETNKITGKPHRHDSRDSNKKTTAFCCADCCNFLMNAKIREVPWGGSNDLKMILAELKNEPLANTIRRRKGA